MPATKQQIRQIIADNNLNSVADVYSLLKDSFKDILQELMEAELDASLGYEKTTKVMLPHPTNVTDILPKPSRASMGNSRLMSQETVRVNLSPNSSQNIRGMYLVLKKK